MPIVNYVREHRRFIRYASDEKLTASERLLWYGLMEIMNQEAEGNVWPDDFIRISNNRLLAVLEPMGVDTMMRARNALKQHGRIDFRPGNKNKLNPAYRMIYFYPEGYTQNAYNGRESNTQNASNIGGNMGYNMGDNMGYNMGANVQGNMGDIYINQNKGYTETKRICVDDDDNGGGVLCAGADEEDPVTDREERTREIGLGFLRAFGRHPYPAELARLVTYSWRRQFTTDMVARAMEIAAGNGAAHPADYAMTVLEDWHNAAVKQPHQIDAYQVEYMRTEGRGGLYAPGDVVEDYRERVEAREERKRENAAAGIG